MSEPYRTEADFLGEQPVLRDVLWGIHTARATENFPLADRPVHPELVRAYGQVKLACARTNRALGVWVDDTVKAEAIERACGEMAEGLLTEHVVVDRLQGGAGTSLNMNVNEVLANRALQLLGDQPGHYARVSPTDDINRHQSTNDTFPTALRLAAIALLRRLDDRLAGLEKSFLAAGKRFAHVVKIGRTEMQDAVLTTLGREMGAYAEAFHRDRRRIRRCEDRLRVVNLGGTAIGTGLAAPREYVLRATEALREVTGLSLARAEDLVDATQNADGFVEASGLIKACATSLLKVCGDLRFMSSGPQAGLGEIHLPQRQAGSSIMPGKVNPVIPEAVSQVAMLVMGYDATITLACASGNLELNPFLPLVANCLLDGIELLGRACDILRRLCVDGLEADERQCRRHVDNSTAAATALVPVLGYEAASHLAERAIRAGRTVREQVAVEQVMTVEQFDALVRAEATCGLGQPQGEAPPADLTTSRDKS
ncbi:MAG: aspartate ammonia-lyase [Planctomycetes bacterium]|nr:aspartate ammonia-lyase [Planctomycetota bacterium]